MIEILSDLFSKIDFGDVPTWVASVVATFTIYFLYKNLKAQDFQIKEQKKDLENQKKSANEVKKRKYADSFGFYVEANLLNPRIHFINDSLLPIIDVSVYCYSLADDSSILIYGSNNKTISFRAIPRGNLWFHQLPANCFDLTKEVKVYFTDNMGIKWLRSSKGICKEVKGNYLIGQEILDIPQ